MTKGREGSAYPLSTKRFEVNRFVALICGLILSCMLVACDAGEQVDSVQTTELDERAIVAATQEEIDSIKPTSDFEKHLLKQVSFEVGDVHVEGDAATLDVRVTNVDVSKAVKDACKDLGEGDEVARIGDLYREDDINALDDAVMEVICDHIDHSTDKVTQNVVLHLTKKDNTWSLDKGSAEEFAHAVYPGLSDLT